MAKPGPKTTPGALKLIDGNPGHRPINLDAGIHPPVEIPGCPSHLNEHAKKEWKRVSVLLEPLGLISELDRAILSMYCQCWGRWVYAELKMRELEKQKPDSGYIQTSPNGYEQMSHWMIIANKAMEQTYKFANDFAMSPSARASAVASAAQKTVETPQLPGMPAVPTRPTLASFNDRR